MATLRAIGSDPQSQVQIDLGSSGVPESFVVDGQGDHPLPAYRPDRGSDVPMILAKLEEAK